MAKAYEVVIQARNDTFAGVRAARETLRTFGKTIAADSANQAKQTVKTVAATRGGVNADEIDAVTGGARWLRAGAKVMIYGRALETVGNILTAATQKSSSGLERFHNVLDAIPGVAQGAILGRSIREAFTDEGKIDSAYAKRIHDDMVKNANRETAFMKAQQGLVGMRNQVGVEISMSGKRGIDAELAGIEEVRKARLKVISEANAGVNHPQAIKAIAEVEAAARLKSGDAIMNRRRQQLYEIEKAEANGIENNAQRKRRLMEIEHKRELSLAAERDKELIKQRQGVEKGQLDKELKKERANAEGRVPWGAETYQSRFLAAKPGVNPDYTRIDTQIVLATKQVEISTQQMRKLDEIRFRLEKGWDIQVMRN